MEEQEDGWLTVLEKNGLGPAAAIFENYGIDSETDLLVLDPDDFSKLASRGLKPLYAKKLERWCGAVRERAENMLPSSLNTPASSALLSSDWWKSNCATLSGFTYVLREVLTNSPNSFPSQRLFSLFNATYNDDQKKSHADYIELSIQSQFNKRDLY